MVRYPTFFKKKGDCRFHGLFLVKVLKNTHIKVLELVIVRTPFTNITEVLSILVKGFWFICCKSYLFLLIEVRELF